MKKNILITGGAGYIGSHGVVAFEQAGYKTVIVDSLINSNIKALDGIEKILGYKPDFYKIDLRDKESLKKVFKKYEFDGVIHFAGLKAVGESCKNPFLYYENNVLGSSSLFEIMNDFGVKNIIFSSSATVYDENNISPYTEGISKIGTSNPYGTSKLIIENILCDLSKQKKFNVICLRYFNPMGAHFSGFIGENPNGIPNNLLPYILKVYIGELEKLTVFGDDYKTIDGSGVRDYIDVNDLIDGHLLAYEYLSIGGEQKKGFFDEINLGTGKGTSVLQIINLFEKISGKKIKFEIGKRRDGDLAEYYCNPKKAENIFGFKTKINIEESIKNSIKFIKKY